jgi:hypothetical protein
VTLTLDTLRAAQRRANAIFRDMPGGPFGALAVYVTDKAHTVHYDRCRSPSRARRRYRRGILGRVYTVPRVMRTDTAVFVHPALEREFRKACAP